ncbi:MAG: MBL fold metallo-hydrolase [Gammaproteobacteria bacterium]|nr:MBL fold metallo-hydrolase [Gammaproteobacteria bacterium]
MNLAVKIICSLLLLTTIGLLVWRGPAHWQIRQVAPDLPTDTQLLALLEVTDGPVKASFIATSSQNTPEGVLAHTTFLIEWADGRIFMIDSGMDNNTAVEFGEFLTSLTGAGEVQLTGTAAEQLADIGDQIEGIGFTHLHIDHVQGVEDACPTFANIQVFQLKAQYQLHNANTKEGAELIAQSCPPATLVDGTVLSSPKEFPGLAMYSLGGHTPGSTLFAVAVNGTVLLFSGDTTNTKSALIDNQGKGFLYSYILVPEHTDRTAELRRWLADLDSQENMQVIVSHDLNDVAKVLPALK